MPERLWNRIMNWKFRSAEELLDGTEPERIAVLVRLLSKMFGNSGHLDGEMGSAVHATVQTILGADYLGEDDEEE